MPTGGQPRRSGLLRAALLNEALDFNGTSLIRKSCNAKLLQAQAGGERRNLCGQFGAVRTLCRLSARKIGKKAGVIIFARAEEKTFIEVYRQVPG